MTVLRPIDERWLDAANASDLDTLARALEEGRMEPPYTPIQAQQLGLKADAARLVRELAERDGAMSPPVVAWFLRRLARERRAAERRWAEVARLVWSGPTEGHEPTRDTRLVLADLFARAEHQVLVATYVIYEGKKVFAPLAERMKARPAMDVDFYVHLGSKTGTQQDEGDDVAAFLETFRRDQWPTNAPLPRLFYDPETRKHGPKRVTLHAKCVVVDERWAFVTSANFTEAAQERNIEAGVILDHPGLASALAGRFRALRDAGRMKRLG
jgi:phosphatidylserine/phosphatidylglycerophosphate/cardiolipin synthase-like enzyme